LVFKEQLGCGVETVALATRKSNPPKCKANALTTIHWIAEVEKAGKSLLLR